MSEVKTIILHDKIKEDIKEHLHMVLNDAIQYVYETTDADFDELPDDLQIVVKQLQISENTVITML